MIGYIRKFGLVKIYTDDTRTSMEFECRMHDCDLGYECGKYGLYLCKSIDRQLKPLQLHTSYLKRCKASLFLASYMRTNKIYGEYASSK